MEIGLMMFPTDQGLQPVDFAIEAESRGFGSVWLPEHSHIPVSRRTPRSGVPGSGPLPEEYWRTYDQFLALAAAAARTTTISLGTAITLVAQRDPIWLAKEVATIDHLSSGRFRFGVGYGWNHEEMENHGVDPRRRREIVREKVLAMKELWTSAEASFSGDYVRFEPSWAWPKPIQKPHPPILMGASPSSVHFDHVIEFADMWLAVDGRYDIEEAWWRLQALSADRGRDPSTIGLGVLAADLDAHRLSELHEMGAAVVAPILSPLDGDAALAGMDRYASLLEQFDEADQRV